MSSSKTDTTHSSPPPPPYSESLGIQSSHITPASSIIDSYVLPELSNHPTTVVILVPSNVSNLICTSHEPSKDTRATGAFPGERIMGFDSDENVIINRLTGSENRLEYWQRRPAIQVLESRLEEALTAQGYDVSYGLKNTAPARIAGSHESSWRSLERLQATEGKTRIKVEAHEVCLRIENEMGLYETRSGTAIVITVEFGACDASEWG
ncbi:MAG: hypothetical protein LQ350_004373 [Teloschistes chrysophthalmus]|nr:MAG: hypothetical protein LQ350_004373 [Niorma chrysophthalma]